MFLKSEWKRPDLAFEFEVEFNRIDDGHRNLLATIGWHHNAPTFIDVHLAHMLHQTLQMRKRLSVFLHAQAAPPQTSEFLVTAGLEGRLNVATSLGNAMIETIHRILELPIAFIPSAFEDLIGQWFGGENGLRLGRWA